MGCDIHAHFEVKINGKWEHYSNPNIRRNYQIFAKLANVRNYNEIEFISLPRGIPDDISIITKIDLDRYSSDAHSRSWIDNKEIHEFEKFAKSLSEEGFFRFNMEQTGYFFGNSFGGFYNYRNDYPKEIEDLRMVFWFDN